ncbi:hypothetical protein [Bacillus sp. REN10]|uniref:hypothetical protein n=1 Tax=Bacillus sp. REN10 TaxID=2782541 RepID=UPI00193B84EB|nr:hypothetical protein [Bacillus sp. REN10]
MRFFLMAILLAFALGACGDKQASQESWNENKNGKEFAPDKLTKTRADEAKQDDPVNTNQNPNFLDLSPNQPTRGTDIDHARDVIKRFTPYEPGSVWINGNKMRVTVHQKQGRRYTDDEAKEAYKSLVAALPRYKIDMVIK